MSRNFNVFLYEYRTSSYATICRFRNKLFKLNLDREIFYFINKTLKLNKLITKDGIVIDSSVILSSGRPSKTININKNNFETVYSEDLKASWLKKNGLLFYGFKLHISIDMIYGFINEG